MFAADRDLLLLEPALFRDAAWTAQTLLDTTGSISGDTLTLASGDAAAAGISSGHVALVGGLSLEIVQRLSSTALRVSRPRADAADPVIPPPAMTTQPVVVSTFAPQLAIAHRQVLRLLGIDRDAPAPPPGAARESSIVNPGALVLVESLAALHLIFTAAAALSGPDSPAGLRALAYRERFGLERHRAAAMLDLDGDGRPDALRRMDTAFLVRA